jgi:hypothetical protein
MRGITSTMVTAFHEGKAKKKQNTAVEVENGWVVMRLHGSKIAKRRVNGTALLLSAAGYATNTTKERLNGVGQRFGVNIWQKDFEWYWSSSWLDAFPLEGAVRKSNKFNTSSGEWTLVYAGSPTEELYEEARHVNYYK